VLLRWYFYRAMVNGQRYALRGASRNFLVPMMSVITHNIT